MPRWSSLGTGAQLLNLQAWKPEELVSQNDTAARVEIILELSAEDLLVVLLLHFLSVIASFCCFEAYGRVYSRNAD
jgi:hypothetical protein